MLLSALQILNAGGRAMLADEIKAGESVNIEFKVEVPKRSENILKASLHLLIRQAEKLLLVLMMKAMKL